jgi:hypothetical protein
MQRVRTTLGIHTMVSSCEEGYLNISLNQLVSGVQASSQLKIRMVLQQRVMDKVALLRGGFVTNSPFSVRKNDPEGTTFTIFDGNHRFHAIMWLIKNEPGKHDWTMETKVPCNVFSESLTTENAMTYAALLNELQLCAAGGTPLDFLRLILNLSREKMALGMQPTGKDVWDSMTDMFQARGDKVPNDLTIRVIQRVATFLHFLVGVAPKFQRAKEAGIYGEGNNALTEAERLANHNGPALHDLLLAVVSLYRISIPAEFAPKVWEDGKLVDVLFCGASLKGASPNCFLPANVWSFDLATKEIFQAAVSAKYPTLPFVDMPAMFVRMLWAHWVLHGGVPARKTHCVFYLAQLQDGLKQWADYIKKEEDEVFILSYLILSYPILSYLILSYLILSYLILSYLIVLILSYLILSYLILSYLILSYLILS